jgi:hypothetical protein
MTMKPVAAFLIPILILICEKSAAQNCCAPAVAQQGVLGETAALPQVLEIGFHYEYLRSRDLNLEEEMESAGDNVESDWHRTSLSLAYGINRRFSASAVLPYTWKEKSWDRIKDGLSWTNKTEGFGDLSLILRFSLIPRDFVNYQELTFGVGVKMPTGSTDKRNFGFKVPKELQPGTGSWDGIFSLTFFQGFEPADILASCTYVLTGRSNEDYPYEFGNQLYYLLDCNVHLLERVDFSLSLSGTIKAHDTEGDLELKESTGRHQIWLVPGVELQVIPAVLGLQLHCEAPVFQDFNGAQLKSDYNIRASLSCLLPLAGASEEE